MSVDASAKELLTPHEVATALGVSPVTVRQWARKGLIEARVTVGGHRRFTRAALVAFAARMGMTLPEPVTPTGRTSVVAAIDPALVAVLRARLPDLEFLLAGDTFAVGRLVERVRPALLLIDADSASIDAASISSAMAASEVERARTRVVTLGKPVDIDALVAELTQSPGSALPLAADA